MYIIEKTGFGFKLTISGILSEAESNNLLQDSIKAINAHGKEFCSYVDMTKTEIFSPEVKLVVMQLQKYSLENGLVRNAAIVRNNLTKMQISILSRETGFNNIERFFSIEEFEYEKQAMDWILHAISPKLETISQSK